MPKNPTRVELEGFIHHWRFRVGDFKLWPLFGGEMLTAGVIGVLPRLRYILITRGLLGLLNTDELKAVVAHEMGHVRRFHVFLYLLFFLCFALLTSALNDFSFFINDIVLLILLKFQPMMHLISSNDSLYLTIFSVAYSLPLILLLVVYFRYIFGFFLRNSERQADLYALELIGHPFTLISSLEKIALYSGHIEDLPSWHHFSIRQRVDFLMASYRRPRVGRRHHFKLYGAALLFFAAVAVLIGWGSKLQNTHLLRDFHAQAQLRIVENELHREPNNSALYTVYGGLLLESGRHEEAEAALRKALHITPEDPVAMNNLAWLYATSPPPYFKPQKALDLALEAAEIEPKPYVLDTLAEAYFVNGHFKEAIATIREALKKHPDNENYLLEQEKKFKEALRNQEINEKKGYGRENA